MVGHNKKKSLRSTATSSFIPTNGSYKENERDDKDKHMRNQRAGIA
jgi:hypothetical protein